MTKMLSELGCGGRGRVLGIAGDGPVFRRMLDMGIIPGTEVVVEGFAPLGDPMAIRVMGYRLSLRRSEAATVTVETR